MKYLVTGCAGIYRMEGDGIFVGGGAYRRWDR